MARSAGQSPYSMDTHGHSSRGQMAGSNFFQPGAGIQQWKPSWEGKHAVFRFWPRFDGQSFHPMRDPQKAQNNSELPYTDWIRCYDAAVAVGTPNNQVSYFVRNRADIESRGQPDPLSLLYNALEAAVKQRTVQPHWIQYRERQGKGGKPLHRADDVYLAQGFVVEQDSKPRNPWVGRKTDDNTPVVVMSSSAGKALLAEISRRDANGNFVYQDILNTRDGFFAYFCQKGAMPHPHLMQLNLAQMPQPQQGQDGNEEFKKYQVWLAPSYYGSPAAIPQDEALVAQKWKEWDDILNFPSLSEQVSLLCSCGFSPDLLMYALHDQFGEYIPSHIRTKAQQSSMLAPPMPYPQTLQQQFPQQFPQQQPYAPPGGAYPGYPPAIGYPPQGGYPQPGYGQPPASMYEQPQPQYQPAPPPGDPRYMPQQTLPPQPGYQPPQGMPHYQAQPPAPPPAGVYPPGTPPHMMQPAPVGPPPPTPDAAVQGAYGAFPPAQPQQYPTQQQYAPQQYQPAPPQGQVQPQYYQPAGSQSYQPQVAPQQYPPQQQYAPQPQVALQPPMGAPTGPLPQPSSQSVMSPQNVPPQPSYADPARQAATVAALEKARSQPRPPVGAA
jgi:hypothetical protein